MSENLLNEIKKFLTSMNLSNYEINAFMTLFHESNLTAREISSRSNVPTGRIYLVKIHLV